jgi:hypothetical protein
MTLRMAKRIRMGDIEPLLGPCGATGAYFRENFPDGVDLTAAEGWQAVQEMYDRGLAIECVLTAALHEGQRKRLIGRLVEERKQLLGVTTQEEIAEIIYPGEPSPPGPLSPDGGEGEIEALREARKEVAYGIMVDLGTEGRPRDLVLALRATETAIQALTPGPSPEERERGEVDPRAQLVRGIRDRGLAWFRQEITDAVREGRVKDEVG